MNAAAEVLEALEQASVRVGVSEDGERVVLSPASKAPSALVEQVKEHKPAVLTLVRERGNQKLARVEKAIDESPRLQEVVRICLKGIFDGEHKTGTQVYRDGSAGILAGALAAQFLERKPTGWRAWLGEARAVLDARRL
jgi:hypothetical protein